MMLRSSLFRRSTAAAACAAVLVLVLGCGGGDGPPRFHVSGTINLDGKPAPAGTILFDPDTSKGNEGPQGDALIRNGRYDTSQGGRGMVGGPHRVRISIFDGVGTNDDAPYGRPLRLGYETTRDLAAESTTEDFEVPTAAGQ